MYNILNISFERPGNPDFLAVVPIRAEEVASAVKLALSSVIVENPHTAEAVDTQTQQIFTPVVSPHAEPVFESSYNQQAHLHTAEKNVADSFSLDDGRDQKGYIEYMSKPVVPESPQQSNQTLAG